MESVLDIIVRSTEIDMNGHVNNAKYLEYLEWGRDEWFDKAGLDFDTFLAMGMQTVMVNINMNYRKECRQGEALTIRTRPCRAGRSSFALLQEIVGAEGKIRADAVVTCVTIDAVNRVSREMPQQLRDVLERERNDTM
ncbi:acyl-CoA thioesterase [Paenibacillus beijingensis]|uniref:Thioesterase n=1 Tax=Paenibacillus beijingensis TaxID=1126833 RepID=A0A0D5NRG0_9BACL|nr:acyl-CoA thioesterase [Paenibacillus beijingensis]AJY77730.1 thioesterase [Paenibacillus beijingensis]